MYKKIIFSIIAIFGAFLPIQAQPINNHLDDYDVSYVTSTGQTLYFVISNNTAHVVFHSSYDTSLVGVLSVPSHVIYQDSSYAVTSLSMAYINNNGSYSGTFYHCTSLTSIELPNTIDTIGGLAFALDSSLSSLIIPTSVVCIDFSAFLRCESLSSMVIPSSVSYIGPGIFSGCNNLTSIIVDSLNTNYDSRNSCNAIIERSTNTLVSGCKASVIPNSVVEIGYRAFFLFDLSSSNMVMPNSVEKIGYEAFSNCIFSNLTLPDSIRYIGDWAFQWCSGFDTIEIPSSVDSIGGLAFSHCTNLKTIVFNAVNCYQTGYNTAYSPFNYCDSIISLIIGDGVQYIRNNLFKNIISLENIESHCVVPPILNQGAFGGIPENIRITIPCGSIDEYVNAPYWNSFDNIMEDETCARLCMVSVKNGHNTLIWNKEHEVVAYNLFREGNVAGTYEIIATIPYDSMPIYVDYESRPITRSYRYKINAVLDSYGTESSLSEAHKTMHLTISQGLGGRWNLQWTPYEGAEYTTYIIYRGTTADSLEQIDIMPADGNTSYTDETATDGDVFYQVGIVMANGCASMESKSASVSRSNIATNASTQGIYNIDADGISIRSESGRIVVNGTTDEVRVFDMVGRIIRNEALPAGVYMVKVGDRPARKMVVIK